MINTSDFLHLMINMTCISYCRRNLDLRMRILRFVINSSIVIILILHSFNSHHLILFRFVHLNLQQSVNHFVLRINMRVSLFYLHLSRINMLVLHRHLWFLLRSFKIQSMRIIMNRHNLDSYKTSSRNCRNWTKFIKMTKNLKTQTTTSNSS